MYHKIGFLKKFVTLLKDLSETLPRVLHEEVFLGDMDLAFLLSKLLIWNQSERDMLETNHYKMKKIEKIKIFDKRTMPWTEKLLQEEGLEDIVELRKIILEYLDSVVSQKSFRDSLSEDKVARFHAYLKAEFLDKLRLFSLFSNQEKMHIVSIVQSIPLFNVTKNGISIFQKDLFEETLNFYDAGKVLGLGC